MKPIKKILYIEDDTFIGEMYGRSLSDAGYDVTLISNGTDGLRAALSGQYDLILVDIMLPEKLGSEILRTLRSDGTDRVPGSRIIVLTNYEQDDQSKLALQSRADGYLIKADTTPHRLRQIIAGLQSGSAPSNA